MYGHNMGGHREEHFFTPKFDGDDVWVSEEKRVQVMNHADKLIGRFPRQRGSKGIEILQEVQRTIFNGRLTQDQARLVNEAEARLEAINEWNSSLVGPVREKFSSKVGLCLEHFDHFNSEGKVDPRSSLRKKKTQVDGLVEKIADNELDISPEDLEILKVFAGQLLTRLPEDVQPIDRTFLELRGTQIYFGRCQEEIEEKRVSLQEQYDLLDSGQE